MTATVAPRRHTNRWIPVALVLVAIVATLALAAAAFAYTGNSTQAPTPAVSSVGSDGCVPLGNFRQAC
jgi:hypothetical protein